LSIRSFVRIALDENVPDHSTISRTRRLMDVETHQAVFQWVLQVLAEKKLLKGTTIGVDATTLEANAALRSIVRRDTGEKYDEFLTRLAKESGIETPTREQLAKLDRKRTKKGSNDDWKHPHDPDARITKMKDGRTHLAHKAEHAVDMETGAIVAVTLHGADAGDTATIQETVAEAGERELPPRWWEPVLSLPHPGPHKRQDDGAVFGEPWSRRPASRTGQAIATESGVVASHKELGSGMTAAGLLLLSQ
jgi:transposase